MYFFYLQIYRFNRLQMFKIPNPIVNTNVSTSSSLSATGLGEIEVEKVSMLLIELIYEISSSSYVDPQTMTYNSIQLCLLFRLLGSGKSISY